MTIPEARLEESESEHGLVPAGEGWFVLNAKEGRWRHREGRGERLLFEGEEPFPQLGFSLYVLNPGEPIGMYHWEADEEDFLVLSGEGLLLIEGQKRALRQWDFVHCPPRTEHMIVGAGQSRCIIVAVGARDKSVGPNWGGYTVDDVALRHRAGVEKATSDVAEAYARFPPAEHASYQDGWLP
jgi:uncharacterized cupin superfamily protein